MSVNASLIYQNTHNALGLIQNVGLNGSLQKSYGKGKFNTGGNVGYFRNGTAETAGSTLQIGGNMNYTLSKNSSFFLNAQWQHTTTGGVQGKTWSEVFGNSGLSVRF